jgi:hypothetical protein
METTFQLHVSELNSDFIDIIKNYLKINPFPSLFQKLMNGIYMPKKHQKPINRGCKKP